MERVGIPSKSIHAESLYAESIRSESEQQPRPEPASVEKFQRVRWLLLMQ
jgi:hypothetical protein